LELPAANKFSKEKNMNTKMIIVLLAAVLFIGPVQIFAADANSAETKDVNSATELKTIELPKPQMEGGKPLMQALKERKTSREKLPLQVLSNMLWAACGVNRMDGKRTAPTAMNKQEIDVYVAMEDGLWLYDAELNRLIGIVARDIRETTGKQPFVKDAPVNLVYVADYAKMANMSIVQKDIYAAADTGFVSQNVYLYCASEGLATVVRGMINKGLLTAVMKLRSDQSIVLAQTVGYPKK
jgi:nitroreductase